MSASSTKGRPRNKKQTAMKTETGTKVLRFHGDSDDTFGEFEAFLDCFADTAHAARRASSGMPLRPIEWAVTDSRGFGVVVAGQYGKRNACWSISVLPWRGRDESPPMPDWPMRFEKPDPEYAHSPVLVIEAPADVELRCFQREDDGV